MSCHGLLNLDIEDYALGAVYTYVFASDSPSDLHANRIHIQFSVRFPIQHQSTPNFEIVVKLHLF
jgi:hypothetical protein